LRKTFLSLLLTFLLGPGIGHFIIGKFKRGAAIFGFTMLAAILFFLEAVRSSPKPLVSGQNPMLFLQDFYTSQPDIVFVFDVIFAAVWAFAFIDVFYQSGGMELFKKREDEEPPI
jgi:hypothetical protein